MATTKQWPLGSKIHITGDFYNSAGALADPEYVYFQLLVPLTGVVQKKYGVDPEIIKTDIGKYYIDHDNDKSGTYFYRWISTGSGQAAEPDGSFVVSTSKFDIPE